MQMLKAVEQKIIEVDSRYHPARGDPLARAKGSGQFAASSLRAAEGRPRPR
jgi:hypothetical protein